MTPGIGSLGFDDFLAMKGMVVDLQGSHFCVLGRCFKMGSVPVEVPLVNDADIETHNSKKQHSNDLFEGLCLDC